MGQALYRKHRPKTLGEIIGQEHVTSTLSNALKAGKISHAYLLTGPRGTGKTSIARILAHEINKLPYGDEAHLDIIEIDAASNRRIDEIRDLRDRVNTAPASAKYKVYIIDEVHMLTKEAFNALLKTLEEPPAHVVFILATTEAHKLPDTIISRTQRYSFRPVAQDKVTAHLSAIAKQEKITIDAAALELIARHGEGSFRDSIGLLDQVSSVSHTVTRHDVEQTLGLAPDELIEELVQSLAVDDASLLVGSLNELTARGFEPASIAAQLSAQLRTGVVTGTSSQPSADLALLRGLLDVPASRNPKQLLEITLLQAIVPRVQHAPVAAPEVVAPQPVAQKPTSKKTEPKPASSPEPRDSKNDTSPAPKEALVLAQPAASAPLEDIAELWQATLDDIKRQYNTLYGIARMAHAELHGDQLVLTFKFAFHQKRLNEAKNRKLFADVVERLYGKPLEIICVVGELAEAATTPKPDVSAISNIFGGAELLES